MEIAFIIFVAFAASLLTFFSGFGLGTILTPVLAIFFPVELAIALTGIVHFLNNLFKSFLVGKFANKAVLIRFGIPAVIASFAGAWLLIQLSSMPPFYQYQLGAIQHEVTPVKLIVGFLLFIFAVIEIFPVAIKTETKNNKHLIAGGILSGFFGGLSGLQGAIRSAFLIKTGLSKESYIGTAVIIACFVDITRLSVYSTRFDDSGLVNNLSLVISATLSAFLGTLIGNKLLKKVTLGLIQKLVAIMLILISFLLGLGLI